ncbi:MAG: AAA family ATPase [Saprospiraceae bacterium]
MSAIHEPVRVAAIYNPQTQTKAQLIEGFVVRQHTFKTLFEAIKSAKMDVPEQHYLILGRRGMGKTTLLLRLAYEVENDPALNGWLIPLVFNEEEYGIRRLFNFWERIMQLLEQKHPDFRFEETELRRLSVRHDKDDDAYERALFDWLSGELERKGKKLVLFIDNFGDMARKLTDAEAHRLRKILQTSSDIRIFAASAVVLEAFYRYDHPFYEFFKQVQLQGLNEKETRDLLLSLSQHYKKAAVERILEQNPGRVEALRRVTGGVVRTMVLLFEIFADDDDGSAFKDLEIVLDRSTPLYKHRMDDLSDQQQAIVEAIALNWDALSVKEIAERTRLESKIISAQLQYLERNGIIEKRATKTKNHLYLVAERFFNIWFLMRLGRRSDEKRVLWLVRFFEEWCDRDMMKSRADQHRSALQRGGFDPEAAWSYTTALVNTRKLSPSDSHELLQTTRSYLREQSPERAQELMPSDLDKAYAALELWFSGQKAAAVEQLRPLCERLFEKERLEKITAGVQAEGEMVFWVKEMAEVANWIGCDFSDLRTPDNERAERCWRWAASAGQVMAIYNLGWLHDTVKKDYDTAIEWYRKAADARDAGAMFNLGLLYKNEKKDIESALEWYQKAADAGDAGAMFNLGWLYQDEKKDIESALEWYQKAAEAGYAGAMNNIGVLYINEKKDIESALEWYLKAAEAGNASGMNSVSWLLFTKTKEKEIALRWSLELIKKQPDAAYFQHTAACVFAWNNRLEESKKLAIEFLNDVELMENASDDITTYFTLLLGKNEAAWLYDLFTGPVGEVAQLKDRYKPVWYAVLQQLDHPDFLRMGDELTQTVEEILAQAREMGAAGDAA